MRVNYKELADRYRLSGLTMKDFGLDIGMSPSMVSYYLKRAKEEEEVVKEDKFSQIELGSAIVRSAIKISTSSGLIIEVPI